MGIIIELAASKALLRFEIVNKEFKWCRVYLIDDKTNELGTGPFEDICMRLISFLKIEHLSDMQIFERKGQKLIWITSLAEKHSTLYGTWTIPSSSECTKIYFQDADGHMFAEICLSEQTIHNWISQLECLLNK